MKLDRYRALLLESYNKGCINIHEKTIMGNVHKLQIDMVKRYDIYGIRIISNTNSAISGLYTSDDRLQVINIFKSLKDIESVLHFMTVNVYSVDTDLWQMIINDEVKYMKDHDGEFGKVFDDPSGDENSGGSSFKGSSKKGGKHNSKGSFSGGSSDFNTDTDSSESSDDYTDDTSSDLDSNEEPVLNDFDEINKELEEN
jgi:hypothetical protein